MPPRPPPQSRPEASRKVCPAQRIPPKPYRAAPPGPPPPAPPKACRAGGLSLHPYSLPVMRRAPPVPLPPAGPASARRCALGWSLLLLTAVGVCLICDFAVNGGAGWSLYPAASCLFAGSLTLPLIRRGTKGIRSALCRLTLLIGPYLALLDLLLARSGFREQVSILPIGFASALPGLLFLWGCFYAVSWLKARPLRAGAACAGLAAVTILAEDALLAPLLNTRLLDVWDWLVMLLLGLLAAALLWLDGRRAACRDKNREEAAA